MTTPILAASGLTKRFGGLTAVDNIEIAVPPTSVVGVIGPNGAGKTTLLNLLSGALRPDEGEIRRPRPSRSATHLSKHPTLLNGHSP